jgi:hypothetical protein
MHVGVQTDSSTYRVHIGITTVRASIIHKCLKDLYRTFPKIVSAYQRSWRRVDVHASAEVSAASSAPLFHLN